VRGGEACIAVHKEGTDAKRSVGMNQGQKILRADMHKEAVLYVPVNIKSYTHLLRLKLNSTVTRPILC